MDATPGHIVTRGSHFWGFWIVARHLFWGGFGWQVGSNALPIQQGSGASPLTFELNPDFGLVSSNKLTARTSWQLELF